MEILKKIRAVKDEILAGTSPSLARDLARAGREAMYTGMRDSKGEVTEEWKELMRNFANNETELKRLCGEDPNFNNSQWGLACLAYIMGNSTCTSDTARQNGTERGFTDEMKENLDAEETNLQAFKIAESRSMDTTRAAADAGDLGNPGNMDSSITDASNERKQ